MKDQEKQGVPVRAIGDLLPNRAPFYPEAARIDFRALVGEEIVIHDATIYPGFQTAYGAHDLCLILLTTVDGRQFTTASSGQVVVDKMRQLIEAEAWPIMAHVTKDGRYYDLV